MNGARGLVGGDGHLRVAPWRGDRSTAYLVPSRGRPSVSGVSRCLEELRRDGFRSAVTAALATPEQAPFLAAGFTVHERLHLLTRRLDDLPLDERPAPVRLRRARRSSWEAVLEVDHAAFPSFWRLDPGGLEEALGATSTSRLRIGVDDAEQVVAYTVTGRSGARGYLQRLAVVPGWQRQGLGSTMVLDGLRWLRRWGAREVMVNTQESNRAAIALYQRLGFHLEADGLAVLHRQVACTS